MGLLQTALGVIYPPSCSLCEAEVDTTGGLCGACWVEARFLDGCLCGLCGVPLPGENAEDGLRCDDCLSIVRPWTKGRSAMIYAGAARQMVLRLKHGDRLDLVRPAAQWMARAAEGVMPVDPLLVPVPLHWTRLIARRYNQAALLAREVGRIAEADVAPMALRRIRRTPKQERTTLADRFETMSGAISADPVHGAVMQGRNVVLIDDVMTSGATLSACADACLSARAADVRVVTLARVVKDA